MSFDYFLPSSSWGKSMRALIFTPSIFSVISGAGVLGIISGPIGLILALMSGGLLYYVVLAIIIAVLIKRNRDKKFKAILEVYGNRYTEEQLKSMYEENRKEFNRLYKLSSDEFFRKYIEEQENHKKAQEMIVTMQKRINDMYEKYNKLKEKEEKHHKEIKELKNEIELYEDILKNWKNVGGQLCLTS